jgi:transcriptional regulator with XRE-family HTH domain
MKRTSIAVGKGLRDFGRHVSDWRKLNGLTAVELATRAEISRDTLRSLESGTGTVNLENTFRVLQALGILQPVTAAANPLTTDVGRLRMGERLPIRVRPAKEPDGG